MLVQMNWKENPISFNQMTTRRFPYRAQTSKVSATFFLTNKMTADEESGSAGNNDASHVKHQSRNESGKESQNAFVFIDLNDRSDQWIVLDFASNKLRHHTNGDDMKRRTDDSPSSMNDNVALKLSLKSLVIFVLAHVVLLFVVNFSDSKLVSQALAEVSRNNVPANLW